MAEAKRRPHAIYEFSPSMTKQSFKEELDINKIIERAKAGQDISAAFRERVAKYGDFSAVPTYQEALNIVNHANDSFMLLDASIRERFSNDPAEMIEFLQDSRNYDEAVRLGLVVPKEPVVEAPVEPLVTSKAKASSDAKSTKRSVGDEA